MLYHTENDRLIAKLPTQEQKEKAIEIHRKKKIFDALRNLMAKLVWVESIDLVNDQVNRIDAWLEEKITATESGGAAADKKSLEQEAHKRAMVQKLKAYNQGMTQLPPLKCKCGLINCDRQCGPMGTLSLQDIIEQTDQKKSGISRMSSLGPRNQANILMN